MGPGEGEGSQDASSCVPGTHHWLRCRPPHSPVRPSGRPTCSSTLGWRRTSGRARLAGAFWGPGHRPHPRGDGVRPPRSGRGASWSPLRWRDAAAGCHTKAAAGRRGGAGRGRGRQEGAGAAAAEIKPPRRPVGWCCGCSGARAARVPAAALSSLRAPTATWGSKRGRVSTGCAVPATGRRAGTVLRASPRPGAGAGTFSGRWSHGCERARISRPYPPRVGPFRCARD